MKGAELNSGNEADGSGEGDAAGAGPDAPAITRAFGEANRSRLVDQYFDTAGALTPGNAWEHVYRLLLWTDPTIGLAHCYESDKCQPGKPWYLRSLAFHAWLARAFAVPPARLADEIDWLFTRANRDLQAAVDRLQQARDTAAARQRASFAADDMPVPGEDPELVDVLTRAFGDALGGALSDDEWRTVVRRVRLHVGAENKRRNLVGEGFEDVLAQVVRRVVPAGTWHVRTRAVLGSLPGFDRARPRPGDKPVKVDLALDPIQRDAPRALVTVKWSIRSDREKQFPADFQEYVQARSDAIPFAHVLITNEFDPARLRRACEEREGAGALFSHVVHLSPAAVVATYAADRAAGLRVRTELPSQDLVRQYVDEGRLMSLEGWLSALATGRA